jgi:hypothetical protein
MTPVVGALPESVFALIIFWSIWPKWATAPLNWNLIRRQGMRQRVTGRLLLTERLRASRALILTPTWLFEECGAAVQPYAIGAYAAIIATCQSSTGIKPRPAFQHPRGRSSCEDANF